MKKSTLLLLVVAIALGCFVYFYDMKHNAPKENSADETKPAFSFSSPDVTAITITRAGQKMVFDDKNGTWQVTSPIQTKADQSTLDGMAVELSNARVSRTLPATESDLSSYGLSNPDVSVDFQLKNGAKHELQLGGKDFTGNSVYGIVDNSKQVSLFPASLLVTVDKPLDQLRDTTVLPFTTDKVASIELKNPNGEIEADKKSSTWTLIKPREVPADGNLLDSFLSDLSIAKMTGVVSETPTDLPKYGLSSPEITATLKMSDGKQDSLFVGKKVGDDYYARDASRPEIFKINGDLYKKLDQKFFDFRDKSFYHFDSSLLSKIEVHNADTKETIDIHQDRDSNWIIDSPANLKGKKFNISKLSLPLDEATAKEILDTPPASVTSTLAKPAIEITFINMAGKNTSIVFSPVSGDFVYARFSDSPAVYKLDKNTFNDLNFKASDGVS